MERMIDLLLSRASTSEFADPGPDAAQLDLILAAALRAPDHGRLRPWRFYVVRDEARAALSGLFAEALRRRDPAAPAEQIAKERGKPLRAPVTVVVTAQVVEGGKIPAVEQVCSAASAAMNILNAAHFLGFAAKWVTGPNCYDAEFRSAFGLDPSEQLIGFIHIGSPSGTRPAPDRPALSAHVRHWRP